MTLRLFVLTFAVGALTTVGARVGPEAAGPSSPAGAQDTIERTLRWSGAGEHTLEVSTVSGSIHVVGEDRQDVEMIADKTIDSNRWNRFKGTRRDIRLDATESADTIRICADADRCGCGETDRRSGDWWRDWDFVHVDFTIRVPKSTRLKLCAVNHGAVTVESIEGDFDVRNVNGRIEMTGIRGSGRAETVNGPVHATFAANPKTSSSFKTVNGRIEVVFPRDLAADLRLKTLNGGLYTDFDVTTLASTPVVAERRNGKFVYRGDRFAAVRVGSGGPQITFEGVNGDVHILRGDR
jgi:hypothetical protein